MQQTNLLTATPEVYGAEFVLTLFTDDPALAEAADWAGIDRIGPDLERLGKVERQGGLGCWISDHDPAALPEIAVRLKRANLFARTNPLHDESQAEIDRLLAVGVRVLMLPMFRTADEASRFVELVGGRAFVSLLVESEAAARNLSAIVRVDGVGEIHVGLNDLSLDLGLKSHFQVLVSPLLDELAAIVHQAGLPFGFGGVARPVRNDLPVPPDLVLAQYPRLGATRALVSRSFFRGRGHWDGSSLADAVDSVRKRLGAWYAEPLPVLERAKEELAVILGL